MGPLGLLVVGPSDQQRLRVLLDRPFALVGRNTRSDVRLDAQQVDDQHAYFQVLGGRLFCIDLDSRSGVRAGNGRLSSGWLDQGKFVRVGPYHLSCKFDSLPDANSSDPWAHLYDWRYIRKGSLLAATLAR